MSAEKAKPFINSCSASDGQAYYNNYCAFKPGISREESTQVYDKWTTYEDDLNSERYIGPRIAAQAVGEFFTTNKDCLIIDVASGTGFVGEELKKLGFQRMHALEPSFSLMERARQKNIYQKDFPCYVNENRLPIDSGVYDCAVIAGGMGEGHIPPVGLYELARIVKPGGLVCITMREEYLDHVQEYREGQLESVMRRMEEGGTWKLASKAIIPRYYFDHNGVVFKFVVC